MVYDLNKPNAIFEEIIKSKDDDKFTKIPKNEALDKLKEIGIKEILKNIKKDL